MNREPLVDREELRQQLLAHVEREGAGLVEKLTGVFGELLDRRDPMKFEHLFVEAIHGFGAGMLGRGLQAIESEATAAVKKGATT